MTFHISGLDPKPFTQYFGQSDEQLKEQGVIRYQVDNNPGFPDRVELRDLELGEAALLINFEHLPVKSPYRSRHAVFVREGATVPATFENSVPESLSSRLLALRAFDHQDMMINANLAQGSDIAVLIREMFKSDSTSYIHAHYARRGCFAARIDRLKH